MQTFDVYLKKRLTEIDVTISQLVQRDTFSMYNWLNLLCSMNELEILKSIRVDVDTELNTELGNLLEIVHEKINAEMQLQANVDLYSGIAAEMEAEMELFASKADSLVQSFAEGNSALEISVDRLDYYIAHSFGNVEFDMNLMTGQVETLKKSLERFQTDLTLNADVVFASQKKVELDDISMYLDIAPTDIFYLLTVGGNAITNLYATSIDDYALKKVLHDVECEMSLGSETTDLLNLKKYIDVEDSLFSLVDITGVLISLIHSAQSEMVMSCEASIGLKRYRKLSEMDDLTLADFDNMTLREIDYVIIAE